MQVGGGATAMPLGSLHTLTVGVVQSSSSFPLLLWVRGHVCRGLPLGECLLLVLLLVLLLFVSKLSVQYLSAGVTSSLLQT